MSDSKMLDWVAENLKECNELDCAKNSVKLEIIYFDKQGNQFVTTATGRNQRQAFRKAVKTGINQTKK